MTESSLYERLGGVFAIAAVVDRFSDALIENPIVGQGSSNPALREWHTNNLGRLPGLKFMRTCGSATCPGGPFEYTPTEPGARHWGSKRLIANSGSHLTSSTRWPPSWQGRSTPSRYRQGRRTRSWAPSPHTRTR